jgi:hypothetical protein
VTKAASIPSPTRRTSGAPSPPGLYHARSIAKGEDQNELLPYSFAENHWDVVGITETDGSDLPGVGHDEGNASVDTVNGLYIIDGNLTLIYSCSIAHDDWIVEYPYRGPTGDIQPGGHPVRENSIVYGAPSRTRSC